MANEAVLKLETQPAIPFTCAANTTFEKGECVKLTDDMTVAIADGDEDYCGGIVQSEKLSNSKTKVSVYRGGIFKVYASGSITAGQTMTISASTTGSNIFVVSDATCVSSKTWGIALEDHSGNASQMWMELRPGVNTNAYT